MSTQGLLEKQVVGLPEALQSEGYHFARCLRTKREGGLLNGLLLCGFALAKNWNVPEEDAAWANP